MSKTIDFRVENLSPGDSVITSKGFEFRLLEKGTWLDVTSGIIWYPQEPGEYDHYEAMEKFGIRLPNKEKFEVAESHGFRQVLGITSGYFWSASLHPTISGHAFGFNGGYGGVGYGSRRYKRAVRCVDDWPRFMRDSR